MSIWPQLTVLAMFFIGIGISLAKLGQPKKDTYDLSDIIAPFVMLWLLYMGGFWVPLSP